jgi:hypothetical protein
MSVSGGIGKEDNKPGELWHLVLPSPSPSPDLGSSKHKSEGSLTNGIHDTPSPSFLAFFLLFFLSYAPPSPSSSESTLGPSPSGSLISGLGGEGERLEYLDPGPAPSSVVWVLVRVWVGICPIPMLLSGVERVRVRVRVRPLDLRLPPSRIPSSTSTPPSS